MKNINEHLAQYKSVHLNKKNIATHCVGVPMIMLSIIVLLSTISFSFGIRELHINLAMILAVVLFLYYMLLHAGLAVVALVLLVPLVALGHSLAEGHSPYLIAVVLFVVGWIFQFVGHMFEKAKPAFIDDLNQLFIGPLFLVAEIYFVLGNEPERAEKILQMAIARRKMMVQKAAKTSGK